ncbi:MAG: phosphoglucosamine mutase, partial [Salinisphaera sp.]|nr:phosphoglucosamine mutase [Salinisphaera sp.]
YIIARARQADGLLRGPVVGTQMSNLGLALALEKAGIAFERAAVGDRYVYERLVERDGLLGGETSGHLLCLDRSTTGDGIVSALQVLSVMALRETALSELVAEVKKCPQVLVNVRIANGNGAHLLASAAVLTAVAAVEADLADAGRVLLRPSGTEPLIRVMVEGHEEPSVRAAAEHIADAVRKAAEA